MRTGLLALIVLTLFWAVPSFAQSNDNWSVGLGYSGVAGNFGSGQTVSFSIAKRIAEVEAGEGAKFDFSYTAFSNPGSVRIDGDGEYFDSMYRDRGTSSIILPKREGEFTISFSVAPFNERVKTYFGVHFMAGAGSGTTTVRWTERIPHWENDEYIERVDTKAVDARYAGLGIGPEGELSLTDYLILNVAITGYTTVFKPTEMANTHYPWSYKGTVGLKVYLH